MAKGADKKQCFVIMPIGDEGSETRKRSDQVLKHIIKPAADAAGYSAERADEIDKPGLITSQVIQRVVSDPLVVADLTEMNPNVFYELALRHAIRKPLVQLIEKGQRIPFDVAATRTVHVDHKDLDSVASAKEDILKQIKALEADPDDIETPISVSLELQNLRQSDNPQDRNLGELLAELSEIRLAVSKLGEDSSQERSDDFRRIRMLLERAMERDVIGLGYPSRNVERLLLEAPGLRGISEGRALSYGILGSVLRDRVPWLSEAAMEVFKQMTFGTGANAVRAEETFRSLVHQSFDSPYFREVYMNDKSSSRLFDILHRFV